MKRMKIYLDNCSYNRPFDEQASLVVRFETDAKLRIQELIKNGELELVWSFVLDYENNANPFKEVKSKIAEWKRLASIDCDYSDIIQQRAAALMKLGLRQMDASHIACAIFAGAECFITTDKKILNKHITDIKVINPIDFIREYPNDQ
jgi:predicted nucleic acid-binding protein